MSKNTEASNYFKKLYTEVWLPRAESGGITIDKVAAGGRPLQTTLNEKKQAMIHERVVELITQVQNRLPAAKSGLVVRLDSRLIVSGEDSLAVEHAGMDLLLRWWRNAKDSAARRVGLVEKELPRGGDATKLP